jgi:hypothetical protein
MDVNGAGTSRARKFDKRAYMAIGLYDKSACIQRGAHEIGRNQFQGITMWMESDPLKGSQLI